MASKGQAGIIGTFFVGILVLMFLSALLPAITQSINAASCTNEKDTIGDLQEKLTQCQNLLLGEQQKSQSAITNLEDCKKQLDLCRSSNSECNKQYVALQQECQKKEHPINMYYFIKVFSDRIVFFDIIIVYHLQLYALFLSIGMTFTIKLFEIDIEIKVLNKKNQRKIVRMIREYLIMHPYVPVLIILGIILITNILLKIVI